MRIEIQPHSLLHLQQISEILYKLHPSVLDELLEMQRTLGGILGFIDLKQPTLEQREFLRGSMEEKEINLFEAILSNYDGYTEEDFYEYKKYLKLNTDEYIPIKISIEVEDPVIGRRVGELINALETTGAIEQFLSAKREADEDAYFAEGYGLRMNEEQKEKMDDFFKHKDCKSLIKVLNKEKLYP